MAGSRAEKLDLSPEVLRWARMRAKLAPKELAKKLGVTPDSVTAWEELGKIGMPQIRKLAKLSLTPLGYLFSDTPPSRTIPVADFRTVGSSEIQDASPELFATMMNMMRRQHWTRETLIEDGEPPHEFVSSCIVGPDTHDQVVAGMRSVLDLAPGWQEGLDYRMARSKFFDSMENAGILAVINGVVDNNTRHALDPEEFRGFALADEYAPLVFVNGNDAISAQMFTCAHECAHIFIGKSGVSRCDLQEHVLPVERFCNAVAAEFLVPARMFKTSMLPDEKCAMFIEESANRFCVSRPVVAYRAHDLGMISRKKLQDYLRKHELDVAQAGKQTHKGGGNFWYNQKYRIGHRFGDSVVRSVLSGKLQYREAWYLTGLRGFSFDKYIEMRRDHL